MDGLPRTMVTLQGLWGHLFALLFSPGSTFSVASLAFALVVAAASLVWTRLRRRRAVSAQGLVRMLFPRRLIRSASSRADFGMALFNTLPAVVLFGWMVAS